MTSKETFKRSDFENIFSTKSKEDKIFQKLSKRVGGNVAEDSSKRKTTRVKSESPERKESNTKKKDYDVSSDSHSSQWTIPALDINRSSSDNDIEVAVLNYNDSTIEAVPTKPEIRKKKKLKDVVEDDLATIDDGEPDYLMQVALENARKLKIAIILLCFILVGVYFCFSLLLLYNESSKNLTSILRPGVVQIQTETELINIPSPTPIVETAPPTTASRLLQIRSVVGSISSDVSLNDPKSPQARALNWVALDDTRLVDISSNVLLQRYALAVLFYSTSGSSSWISKENWLTYDYECTWYGIECSDRGGVQRVTHLKLSENNLAGALPKEIGSFGFLTIFEMWKNKIVGEIPETIGDLHQMEYMYIDDNMLTGTIPSTIGNLLSLQDISLHANKLTGRLPTEIGALSSLWRFWASDNNLSGQIPSEIGSLFSLTTLYIEDNSLTGSLPTELGNLANIADIRMSNNLITGEIPYEMATLNELKFLYLDSNKLNGPFPIWLDKLYSLVDVQFYSNHLTGTLPTEIGGCEMLEVLDIGDNSIGGQIPKSMGDMKNLKSLFLKGNSFFGFLPPELGKLKNLKQAGFEGNLLVGNVPMELCGLTQITELSADCGGSEPLMQCACCTLCV